MLEFSKEKVVGTISIELALTENDIETILVTALEGGINYWAGINNTGKLWEDKPVDEPLSTWATKIILDGGSIQLYDIEDESDTWNLDKHRLIKGLKMNYIKRPHDNDLDRGDAITADCIIQYALFDKIVYA
jgi:hypothetical protein